MHDSIWPITKARSKKIKEVFNGLIQEIWADSNTEHSKFDLKEDEGVINLIKHVNWGSHHLNWVAGIEIILKIDIWNIFKEG